MRAIANEIASELRPSRAASGRSTRGRFPERIRSRF